MGRNAELWGETDERVPTGAAAALHLRDPCCAILPPRGLAPRLDELFEIKQSRAAQPEALRRLSRVTGHLGLRELRHEQRRGQIVSGDRLSQRESGESVRGRVSLVSSVLSTGALDHLVFVVCIRVGILN